MMQIDSSNPLDVSGPSVHAVNPKTVRFSPYQDNGGTALAVAGNDFCVVAADTRLSSGYSIHTRNFSKLSQLTKRCVIASSGMQADMVTLHKVLKSKIEWYEHQHGKSPSTTAIAQLLSITLYQRRFFPYYSFNVLAGLDEQGKGCVYSYDAVGSFESVPYSTSGSGTELVQPFLDNQVGWKNTSKGFQSAGEVIALVKDALTSAGERDIHTGDYADIVVITNEGVRWEKFELKLD